MTDFISGDLTTKLLHVGPFGNGWSQDGSVTFTATDVADTGKVMRIPGGIRLDTLRLNVDDLDTATGIVLNVGYTPVRTTPTENLTYFLATGDTGDDIAQAGGLLECQFDPITFQEDVDIIVTVDTASTTHQTGDVKVVAKGQNIGVK